MILASTWLLTGVYLDGWAHNHVPDLESFFTPWHAVLYSGYLACALILVGQALLAYRAGKRGRALYPAGYGLSLVGVALFFASGLGDMLWHTVWGIEEGIDALFSPTHLGLAIGAGLIVSGPWRATALRAEKQPSTLLSWIPVILSTTFVLSLLTFMTQFIGHVRAAAPAPEVEDIREWFQQLGILYSLIYTTFIVGLFSILQRRWTLPFGFWTVVLGLNGFGMHYAITDELRLIPAALAAGFLIDIIYTILKPSASNLWRMRLFAALIPATFYLTWIIAIMSTTGTWWSIHMWTGAIIFPAVAGWLLSYLFLPPVSVATAQLNR